MEVWRTTIRPWAYRGVRLGLDLRLPIGSPVLLAAVGYQFVSSAGALSHRFPQASVGGADLLAGVGLPLGRKLEARVALTYSRYFYSFNPNVGDAYVAGGGVGSILRSSRRFGAGSFKG